MSDSSGLDKYQRARSSSLRRKQNQTALLGALVLVVGAVLIIMLVMNILNAAKGKINIDEQNRGFYERYLAPFCVLDVPPFGSSDDLSEKDKLNIAIWGVLIELERNTGAYPDAEYADVDRLEIREEWVVQSYRLYFSGEVSHQSIGEGTTMFEYDVENERYLVPLMVLKNTFEPDLKEIAEKNDTVSLRVNYLYGSNFGAYNEVLSGKVAKTMTVTLQVQPADETKPGADKLYRIMSIKTH